jgi:hypothetical protein|tara:strand:+ start:380 stop:508 length:129 start_codon:yes stop_codon:yes gene_type:complete
MSLCVLYGNLVTIRAKSVDIRAISALFSRASREYVDKSRGTG